MRYYERFLNMLTSEKTYYAKCGTTGKDWFSLILVEKELQDHACSGLGLHHITILLQVYF